MNHIVEPMLRPLSWWARQWAEHSQRQACRNAMVASTELAARRQEREEVQLFVDTIIARRAPAGGVTPTSPAAAGLG